MAPPGALTPTYRSPPHSAPLLFLSGLLFSPLRLGVALGAAPALPLCPRPSALPHLILVCSSKVHRSFFAFYLASVDLSPPPLPGPLFVPFASACAVFRLRFVSPGFVAARSLRTLCFVRVRGPLSRGWPCRAPAPASYLPRCAPFPDLLNNTRPLPLLLTLVPSGLDAPAFRSIPRPCPPSLCLGSGLSSSAATSTGFLRRFPALVPPWQRSRLLLFLGRSSLAPRYLVARPPPAPLRVCPTGPLRFPPRALFPGLLPCR